LKVRERREVVEMGIVENEEVVSKIIGEQEEERVDLLRVETRWQELIRKKW
jgi:hypothetical protein